MELLSALLAGVAVTCLTLYATAYGTEGPLARLQRLRRAPGEESIRDAPATSMLRRSRMRFAGLELRGEWADRTMVQLERAGLQWRLTEYVAIRVLVGLVIGVILWILIKHPVALLSIAAGYWLTGVYVNLRIGMRRRKMEGQLVEALQMIANSLRAGFSLAQGIEAAAKQLPDPLAYEMKRALRDITLGASVEQALQNLNERMGSADMEIAVTAIVIQRSVGGNLAEILDTVSNTMRERERIKGEIRTLTAQQRLTGIVIGLTPIGLAGILSLISPGYLTPMLEESFGRILLIAGGVFQVIGFLVMRKLMDIEV